MSFGVTGESDAVQGRPSTAWLGKCGVTVGGSLVVTQNRPWQRGHSSWTSTIAYSNRSPYTTNNTTARSRSMAGISAIARPTIEG